MKLISVTDNNGKVYEFIDGRVTLLKVVTDKRSNKCIIGYREHHCTDEVIGIVYNLEGKVLQGDGVDLTPYDKFKDLKKAFSEGAMIEYFQPLNNLWFSDLSPSWDMEKYRIKGNISIASWNAHKDVIKEYWNGGETVEYRWLGESKWGFTSAREWGTDREYRIKPQPTEELTLEQVCEALGRDIKIVKG